MRKLVGIKYRLVSLLRNKNIQRYENGKAYADSLQSYANKKLYTVDEANERLYNMIINGEPFFAGRFGSTELLNMRSYDFGGFLGQKYDTNFHFNRLCEVSGFFPNKINLLPQFVYEMKLACNEVDFLAIWFQGFEDYYINHYMKKNLSISYLLDFEPWAGKLHWSSALKDKKVLVIHPFEKTIQSQYKNRKYIFPDSDILPEFELITLKAVQTVAGEKDERFEDWFDALNWMYEESMKIDFDIAIIGCGAYGFPLAARLKKAGKQVIHLAGATQLLFGIKGSRWEGNPTFAYIAKYFNDYWVYPSDEDTPKGAKKVENSCYWQ